MNYSFEVDILRDKCEVLKDELNELNPDHELLQFNIEGKTEEEKNIIAQIFFENFAPEGADFDNITEEMLLLMLSSFRLVLNAAIEALLVIDKAKCGFLDSE